jgi:hypothetical protein
LSEKDKRLSDVQPLNVMSGARFLCRRFRPGKHAEFEENRRIEHWRPSSHSEADRNSARI